MITKEPGIYQWRCLKDGNLYVGSAFNLKKRNQTHLQALKANEHANSKFQRAFNLHGEENFIFEILEVVLQFEKESKKKFKTRLVDNREQHYLDTLLHAHLFDGVFDEKGYNICRKADSSLGTFRDEVSKAKMRESAKKKAPVSEETKKKQSKAKLGKDKSYTPEGLLRVQERLGIKIHRYSVKTGKYIDSFISIEDASIECGLNWGMIKLSIDSFKIRGWKYVFSAQQVEKIDLNRFKVRVAGGYKEKKHERVKCQYCDIVTIISNITRYHNEKCKFKDKPYQHFRVLLVERNKKIQPSKTSTTTIKQKAYTNFCKRKGICSIN